MSERIVKKECNKIIDENMLIYGMSVAQDRALPFLEDGFKPAQRRDLWAMSTMGLFNKVTKSAKVAGEVQASYHPHASTYDVIANMTDQAEKMIVPYVKGEGAFGKVYLRDIPPAADRYTEVGLLSICHELFDDIKKNKDNLIDNFDNTKKEPKYISAPWPNVLCNPQSGIAVGLSCSYPSFNFKELCEASKIIIKNIKKTNKELLKEICKVMPTVDFTTGGFTYIDPEQIKSIYETGSGTILLRAKFNNDVKERVLEIIEIPYNTSAEQIVDEIKRCVDNGKLNEISDVRDESGLKGLKVAVDYKKGTDVEDLKKKILSLTSCQSSYSVNMNCVYKGKPVRLGVIDMIRNWVDFRKDWVKITLNYDLDETKDYLHLLEGLEAILLDIDKAVKIVKNSKTDADVITGLKKAFKLDDIQAEFVANIKLRNFNKDYILNKTKEIKDLKAKIKDLQDRLKNIDNELIKDLDRVAKEYGVERKTKIEDKWEELPTFAKNSKEPEKLDGNSILFYGTDSVKRVPEDSTGVKAPNGMSKAVVPNTGEVLIFVNSGKVFKWTIGKLKNNTSIKATDIKKINKKLVSGEQVMYTCPLISANKLVIIYDSGKAAKFSLAQYETSGNKLCFAKGINTKANPLYFEMIEKDKLIEFEGKKIDTAKLKEIQNKTGQGVKYKFEK